MSIHLSPNTESLLADAAQARGTTPDLLAEELLLERLQPEPDAPSTNGAADTDSPETLADQLADFIGVLHSSEHVPGGARMSVRTGEQFAAGMLEKQARRRQ
ncbi:hypothetical protein [Longimicrobium sp.]|uniref:hypothetical protein n=1 Tax=Longimicrobium sp. TaxID=2029185 RepID=UPI002BDAB31B|nr:hypothetical protein [Longimicrobium sp.]HSU14811.1 hypothetical protein [Longimicrobium sp.]